MSALKETLASPLAWGLSAFATVVGALGLGPLVDFLAATSGAWTSVLIVGGRLAGGELGDKVALVGLAGLFVAVVGRFAQKTVRWLRE